MPDLDLLVVAGALSRLGRAPDAGDDPNEHLVALLSRILQARDERRKSTWRQLSELHDDIQMLQEAAAAKARKRFEGRAPALRPRRVPFTASPTALDPPGHSSPRSLRERMRLAKAHLEADPSLAARDLRESLAYERALVVEAAAAAGDGASTDGGQVGGAEGLRAARERLKLHMETAARLLVSMGGSGVQAGAPGDELRSAHEEAEVLRGQVERLRREQSRRLAHTRDDPAPATAELASPASAAETRSAAGKRGAEVGGGVRPRVAVQVAVASAQRPDQARRAIRSSSLPAAEAVGAGSGGGGGERDGSGGGDGGGGGGSDGEGEGGGRDGAGRGGVGDGYASDPELPVTSADVLPLSATWLPRRERADADAISERQRRRTGDSARWGMHTQLGMGMWLGGRGAHSMCPGESRVCVCVAVQGVGGGGRAHSTNGSSRYHARAQ